MAREAEARRPCIFLRVPSQARYLVLERALVREVCQLAGFDAEETDRIVLAVDEACTNVIRHGYDGPCDKPIDISARLLDGEPGGVELTIRDYGRQVDPERLRPRQVGQVRPGGLGVHIIHQVMDEVRYSRAPGAGMQLVLSKHLSSRDSGPAADAPPQNP